MFILQHISTLRGVLPVHEYKQLLKSKDLIIECLNKEFNRLVYDRHKIKRPSILDIESIKDDMYTALVQIITFSNEYRLINSDIRYAKKNMKFLKMEVHNIDGIMSTLSKDRISFSKTHQECIKASVIKEQETIRKLRFMKESIKSDILNKYYLLMDMINKYNNRSSENVEM